MRNQMDARLTVTVTVADRASKWSGAGCKLTTCFFVALRPSKTFLSHAPIFFVPNLTYYYDNYTDDDDGDRHPRLYRWEYHSYRPS